MMKHPTLEMVGHDLDRSRRHERKEDWPEAARSVCHAVMGLIGIATHTFSTDSDAVAFLIRRNTLQEVTRFCEFHDAAILGVNQGRFYETTLINPPMLSIISHAASLVGNHELASRTIRPAVAVRQIRDKGGRFWNAYVEILVAFLEGISCDIPPLPKLHRDEKYMFSYMHLMHAIMNQTDISEALISIDAWFSKRNRDRRIEPDPVMIEGSGYDPISWNFRKAAILAEYRRRGVVV